MGRKSSTARSGGGSAVRSTGWRALRGCAKRDYVDWSLANEFVNLGLVSGEESSPIVGKVAIRDYVDWSQIKNNWAIWLFA